MITSAGVGSGLDIENLISGLLSIERAPIDRLESQKNDVQVEISAIGQLKGAVSRLQVAAQAINDRTTLTGVKAISSDDAVFTASPDSNAVSESHAIVVSVLAQQHKLTSTAYADEDTAIGTGSFDITVAGNTLNLNLTASNNTLAQVRDAINQASNNPGVTASIINVDAGSKLVLTADDSGLANAISTTIDPGLTGFALTQLDAALDASFTLDGFVVTRSSNSFSDVIQGVSLTLTGVGSANLDLQPDSQVLGDAIEEFVDSFNSLRGNIKALRLGALAGDSTLLGLEKRLRDEISSSITIGAASPAYLSELGISFQDDGDLSLDKSKLDTALNADVGKVLDLISDTSVGIGGRIDSFLELYMQSDGIFDIKEETLDDRTDRIDNQIERAEFRLVRVEARLRTQFTALDNLLARLQTTSSFLTEQLPNIARIGNQNN